MLALWLFSCVTEVKPPAPARLDVSPHQLGFRAEVGECDDAELVLANPGGESLDIEVVGPASICDGQPFADLALSMRLGAGDEASFEVRYCPDVVGACETFLSVTSETGEAVEVELLAVATSPDEDGDGYRVSDGDCDDQEAAVNPLIDESENGIDDDCDEQIDEGTSSADDDGDGWSERDGDCDDANTSVNPGAPETWNEVDDDCDGWTDNRTDAFDDDGDGYTEGQGDCDDLDASVFPLATEFPDGHPNGIDDDCDGSIDEETP